MICVDEAKSIFEKFQKKHVQQSEIIYLKNAVTKILAEDIISKYDVPAFDNSAMDGFAAHIECWKEHCKTAKPIIIASEVAAGQRPSALTKKNNNLHAVKIFTGAPIPKGVNCIVPVENCDVKNNTVSLKKEFRNANKYCKLQQHIRPKGLNFTKNEIVLKKGTLLNSMNIAVLASLGLTKIRVYKKLKIAIGVTGDELVNNTKAGNQKIELGKIYDSNTSLLKNVCVRAGFDVVICKHIKDTLNATLQFFSAASQRADVILTSGGISMGDKDFIKIALKNKKVFQTIFQTLSLKPGKPLTFAQYKNTTKTPIIAMPGNPLSVFITFTYFVLPYVYALSGRSHTKISIRKLDSPSSFTKYARTRFLFVTENNNKISLLHEQGSAAIKNLRNAHGAIIIPAYKNIKKGMKVNYFPFNQFGIL